MKKKTKNITRRELLKDAAKAGLAGALTPLSGMAHATPKKKGLIALENEQEGTTDWQLTYVKSVSFRAKALEGYCNKMSLRAGETLAIFLSADVPTDAFIDFYRMGYYGGKGGRFLKRLGPIPVTPQADPPIAEHRLRACQWSNPVSFSIPADWISGIYLGKLSCTAHRYESYIIFVLRDDRKADVLVQTSDTTWQAYNKWPDAFSLYDSDAPQQPLNSRTWVSYDRPFAKYPQVIDQPLSQGSGEFLLWEYPLCYWLEQHGYDVTYWSNLDTHADRAGLDRVKCFLSVGHDEYWTFPMFQHVKDAVDKGLSAGFLSGNALMWVIDLQGAVKINPEAVDGPSALAAESGQRTEAVVDPQGAHNRTISRVGRFGGLSEAEKATGIMGPFKKHAWPNENTLIGARTVYPFNGSADWIVTKPDHWIFEGTGMKKGDKIPGLVGWEHHGDPAEIPGLEVVAEGETLNSAGDTSYYTATVYPGKRENWVFNAATIWWATGLSQPPGMLLPYSHYGRPHGTDDRVQRITANFLKKIGISPVISLLLGVSLLFLSGCGRNIDRDLIDPVSHLQVPDGFVIEEAVSPEQLSFPMFASFDDRGRLFVFESTGVNTMGTEKMLAEPIYHIRLLEDEDGDGKFDKSTIFVDSVPLPMGGTFYQGSLYAAAPPNLMRYTDTDNDGIADKKEVILSGWVLHANAATLHGPFMGPDGWLYLCDARRGFDIKTKEGTRLTGKGARIWRCRPDGSGLEAVAGGGFDNTIEMVFMPGGETIGTMTYFTDPQNGQRDALMHWVEGGVYPKYNSVIDEDQLKLTGELMPVMTKLPRIAHSGLLRYRGDGLGKDYDGNLFSAVFNTGKIMRHRITPVGATFKTEEEEFMTSESPDTHPTDVLQDADGSLLVVLTGGWFIEGCPLSRVAKPDVRGGIYRIRKKEGGSVKDPWGKELELSKKSPEELVGYLNDSRPMVKDATVEQLVAAGPSAVASLVNVLRDKTEANRISGVFALARIGTNEAITAVRGALKDNSVAVRTAASRCLGLAGDRASVDLLMQMVQRDSASVRRQAATALGQIGDPRCIPALLNAASDPDDRFVEHAIIHSLISLQRPELLIPALNHASEGSRKAAVIALDQMDNSPLRPEHVLAFLLSKHPILRHTGVWIASHRPEWSEMVVTFLRKGIDIDQLSEEERASIRKLLITFSENNQLQAYMANELGNSRAATVWKQLLLEIITESPVKEFPQAWTEQLGQLLRSGNDSLQRGVLSLIETRRLPSLNSELTKIIGDDSAGADLRIRALGARVMTIPELSEDEFRILTGFLTPTTESPVRQSAARLLARADLNEPQQQELAAQYVATVDLFLLPSLMSAFEGSESEAVGLALIKALGRTTDRLDNLSEQDMRKLLAGFPANVQKAGEPLMTALSERHAERLSKLAQLEASLSRGDLDRGRTLFFGKGACYTCHAVGLEGAHFGPDLSNIGEIRSSHDILEAIVYPSASFAREYDTYQVKTKTKTYLGVIKEQLPDVLILAVGPGAEIRIPKAEIVSSEQQGISMMPPGLEQSLNKEELSDLMAYLKSLPDSYKTMK